MYITILILFLSFVSSFSQQISGLTPVIEVKRCKGKNEYFDTVLLRCMSCPPNAHSSDTNVHSCECDDGYYRSVESGSKSSFCEACPDSNPATSLDGFGCVLCEDHPSAKKCPPCPPSTVPVEMQVNGTANYPSSSVRNLYRLSVQKCVRCVGLNNTNDTEPIINHQRCETCLKHVLFTPDAAKIPDVCSCPLTANGGFCIFNGLNVNPVTKQMVPSGLTSAYFDAHLSVAYNLCKYSFGKYTNLSACHLLVNIAALQLYDGSKALTLINDVENVYPVDPTSERRLNIPLAVYPASTADNLKRGILCSVLGRYSSARSDTVYVQIVYARFTLSGEFIDFSESNPTLCRHCLSPRFRRPLIGFVCKKKCNVDVKWILNSSQLEPVFYEPYLRYFDLQTDAAKLIPIPVKIDGENRGNTYYKRFFDIDRRTTIPISESSPNHVKVLKEWSAKFWYLQSDMKDDHVKVPVITVKYEKIFPSTTTDSIDIEVTVEFRMELSSTIRIIVLIAIGLSAFAVFCAIIKTCSWQKRQGLCSVDLSVIFHFIMNLIGFCGDFIFMLILGITVYWFIFYRQMIAYVMLPSYPDQMNFFSTLLILGVILKTLDVMYLVLKQSKVDIFFIDWERPRMISENTARFGCGWRLCFVANELNELQACRKLPLVTQIILVLFVLKVNNIGNYTTSDPAISVKDTDICDPSDRFLRVAIFLLLWVSSSFIHSFIHTFLYVRFIKDRACQFVDLCSVANISVFIFTERLHGYYIHGRSPHGTTDVEFVQIIKNLEKEKNDLCGQRGLVPGTAGQTFYVSIQICLREQLDRMIAAFLQMRSPLAAESGKVHGDVNKLLSSYIDHTIRDMDYVIRDRVFLEKLLDFELQDSQRKGLFYPDPTSHAFDRCFFYGHELCLSIWNALVFISVDYYLNNVVVAAFCTLVTEYVLEILRLWFGASNLSRKTLVDKRLLI